MCNLPSHFHLKWVMAILWVYFFNILVMTKKLESLLLVASIWAIWNRHGYHLLLLATNTLLQSLVLAGLIILKTHRKQCSSECIWVECCQVKIRKMPSTSRGALVKLIWIWNLWATLQGEYLSRLASSPSMTRIQMIHSLTKSWVFQS